MITLKEFFDTLAFGELANIQMGSSGSIQQEHYAALVSHINLGLVELYKKFNLKQNTVQLQQQTGVSTYYLNADHLGDESEFDEFTYLLYDEDKPFNNDIVKVIDIYDETGNDYPINNHNALKPIITPEYDVLVMEPFDPLERLYITYQALHGGIKYVALNFNPTKVNMNIHPAIVDALRYYVAGRVFSGISSNVTEGTTTPGMTYDAKYRIACKELEVYNLAITDNDSRQQFTKNGWV